MGIFGLPSVAKHVVTEMSMVHIPMTSVKGAMVDLFALSFAENAKYGEMGRWPALHLFKAHFPFFLEHGYEGEREPLDIRFDLGNATGDTSNLIQLFSIKYIDGQNKAMIMLAIMALVHDLATWWEQQIVY